MSKPVITIDIASDVVCPWCYIGMRRLERAIEQLADTFDFNITYQPFELNPTLPEEGVNQKQYLTTKFGGEDQYHKITQHVKQIAKEEGLNFNFEAQTLSPNTRVLHVIIQFAKQHGLQQTVKEAFMKAYFEDGINLCDRESILALSVSVGLKREDIEPLLKDMTLRQAIEAREHELQAMGVSGVPFFIINKQYGISGAQSSETFVKALSEIGSKTKHSN